MESGEKEPIEKEKKIEICNKIHAELMATIQKFPKVLECMNSGVCDSFDFTPVIKGISEECHRKIAELDAAYCGALK